MDSYEIITFIICLGALFSYVNFRFIKWPPTIGIMALSLLFSIVLISTATLFPAVSATLIHSIAAIDFHSLLMNVLLSFLLYAGSMHIDAKNLKKLQIPIIFLSTAGVLISTIIVGALLFGLCGLIGLKIAFIHCMLFAALISPTDPIAVIAILKRSGISKSMEVKISGESLFNDGVAVVVFVTILEVAQSEIGGLSVSDITLLFGREAIGGLVWGLALGYSSYLAIRSVDKHEVEVFITLATVMGGYMIAQKMHVSGPLSMVVAGLIIGNKARGNAVSAITREYLDKFWELIDEILNAILFLLIGFEMLIVKLNLPLLAIGLVTILIVLFARWVSVAIPISILRTKIKFEKNTIAILTWGGIRGGLSVALALSLPANMHKEELVAITYIVVLFSIIVQGLTIGRLYRRLKQQAATK